MSPIEDEANPESEEEAAPRILAIILGVRGASILCERTSKEVSFWTLNPALSLHFEVH